MPSSAMKHITIGLLFLGIGAFAQTAAPRAASAAADTAVAEKALQMVSDIHGSWTQMPGNIATARMTCEAPWQAGGASTTASVRTARSTTGRRRSSG